MNKAVLTAPPVALAGVLLVLSIAAPAVAAGSVAAGPPAKAARLTLVGDKSGTAVLLDMASRRNVEGEVEVRALLVFPLPPPGQPAPAAPDPAPAPDPAADPASASPPPPPSPPDHGRITLRFDCKAHTIALTRLTLLGGDNSILRADLPVINPQPPVDATDSRLLGLACGEVFPDADKVFADEASAIAAIRTPG